MSNVVGGLVGQMVHLCMSCVRMLPRMYFVQIAHQPHCDESFVYSL